jgi:Protein of unknown function (DUF4235)
MKLIYAPVSVISGLIAGVLSKKLFERAWALIDDAAPPQPKQRRASWPKLIGALFLEGAVFRVVKGAIDHAARRGFAGLTGRWPGEDGPAPRDKL